MEDTEHWHIFYYDTCEFLTSGVQIWVNLALTIHSHMMIILAAF